MSIALTFLRGANGIVGSQVPDSFSFTDLTNQAINSTITSEEITVTGLIAYATVTVSCNVGEIDAGTSALSGTWEASKDVTVSASGSIKVRARRTSSNTYVDSVSQVITVGTGSTTWTVTTSDADLVPSSFSSFYVSGLTPSATAQSLGIGTITGLSPNADYYLEEVDYPTDGVTYLVGANTTPTISVLSFFYGNRTSPISVPFTTDSSGTAYFEIRPILTGYWMSGFVRLRLKSSYTNNTSSIVGSVYTATAATYTATPSVASPQVVASAGIQVEWEVTLTNLPTARGPLTLDLDSDAIGVGDGFDSPDGYSFTQGGSYSTSILGTTVTTSTVTFYVALTSQLQGNGSQLHTVPAFFDVTDTYDQRVRESVDFEVEF